jgi:N-acetylmuramoyl-L-alanine amidase
MEKTFTLALSVRLRSLLGARGIQVVTTRESDSTVDLNRRAEIANQAKAQACLTLHATESGSGVHLFARSPRLSPLASPPGKPRRTPGSRAAWPSSACSTLFSSTPA